MRLRNDDKIEYSTLQDSYSLPLSRLSNDLLESANIGSESSPIPVLCSLVGPIGGWIISSRNHRLYSESLYDKVFESDYVEELFDTKNFLGEPDHPFTWEDRADLHYPYVSHAVRKVWKDSKNGCWMCIVDILDTPNGRILKTLVDYGTKLGISSRGAGDTYKGDDGKVYVDEDTYVFFTLDIVPVPGHKIARLSKAEETDFIDSINQVVHSSKEDSKILETLDYTIDNFKDSMNESVYQSLKNIIGSDIDKLISKSDNHGLLEGDNIDTSTDSINASNLQDLVDAYKIIDNLKSEISELKIELDEVNNSDNLAKVDESEFRLLKVENQKLKSKLSDYVGQLEYAKLECESYESESYAELSQMYDELDSKYNLVISEYIKSRSEILGLDLHLVNKKMDLLSELEISEVDDELRKLLNSSKYLRGNLNPRKYSEKSDNRSRAVVNESFSNKSSSTKSDMSEVISSLKIR